MCGLLAELFLLFGAVVRISEDTRDTGSVYPTLMQHSGCESSQGGGMLVLLVWQEAKGNWVNIPNPYES